jgi:hypothetical protein
MEIEKHPRTGSNNQFRALPVPRTLSSTSLTHEMTKQSHKRPQRSATHAQEATMGESTQIREEPKTLMEKHRALDMQQLQFTYMATSAV